MTGQQTDAVRRAMQQSISHDAGQDQLYDYMMQLMTKYWEQGGTALTDRQRNAIGQRVRSQTHPRGEWGGLRRADSGRQVTQADLRPFERTGPGYTPNSPQPGPVPIVPGQGRGNRPIPTLDQYHAIQKWLQDHSRLQGRGT